MCSFVLSVTPTQVPGTNLGFTLFFLLQSRFVDASLPWICSPNSTTRPLHFAPVNHSDGALPQLPTAQRERMNVECSMPHSRMGWVASISAPILLSNANFVFRVCVLMGPCEILGLNLPTLHAVSPEAGPLARLRSSFFVNVFDLILGPLVQVHVLLSQRESLWVLLLTFIILLLDINAHPPSGT